MEDKTEVKSVSADDLRAGVVLRAGHRTVLIVEGMTGTPAQENPAAQPGEEPAPASPGKPGDEPIAPLEEPAKLDEPQKPEEPAKPDEPKKPEATPSVLGTFEAAHFETAKSFPLPP